MYKKRGEAVNIILVVLCLFLSVLGLVELIRLCSFWVLRPKQADFTFVVVPKNVDSCEFQLRCAAERIKWFDFNNSCRLICVNRNADSKIENAAKILSLTYPFIMLSNCEDLVYNILESKNQDV